MTIDELSQMQLTTILPLIKKSNLKGLGLVTVSQKGRHTNTSIYNNDGADFGPDTLQGATALGQYGPPYSTSVGADEAVTYANKYNLGIYYISSQVFSFLKSLYDILNGDIVKTTVTVGSSPYGVAITPDGNYAYVTNHGSGTVSVIQISTNKVTSTVTVGSSPYGVAITPDGNYAYVANYGSGTVSVIQISTNTVTATITVGSNPIGVAITPDGTYAYVANSGTTTVSVIQISTNTVTATITVGSNPQYIAITPDGNYAYVTNYGSGTVSVVQINSVVNSWHGIKGTIPLNRIYNQNLIAQTNDTTTLTTASTVKITPTFSGNVKIKAVIRGSNDTLSDGTKVALYNGTTSLDSETYTQEGLASNEHTFVMSYDSLSSALTLNTEYTFTVQFAAVTGGTASVKVVEFSAEEY